MFHDSNAITSPEAQARHYEAPRENMLTKVVSRLGATTCAFIAAGPLCVLATNGGNGPHASPRGEAPDFMNCLGDGDVALTDRSGADHCGSQALRAICGTRRNPGQHHPGELAGNRTVTRANMRSRLLGDLPRPAGVLTARQMIAAHTGIMVDPTAHDTAAVARLAARLYGRQVTPAAAPLPTHPQCARVRHGAQAPLRHPFQQKAR